MLINKVGCLAVRFIKYCYTRCLMRQGSDDMQLFHGHDEEKLRCPYKGCEKQFDKPTVITDNSVIPRQEHYACPFCMSKLDIKHHNSKIISIKPTEYPTVLDSPAKCAHFSGLLHAPGRKHAKPGRMPYLPKSNAVQHTQKII